MVLPETNTWVDSMRNSLASYRRMIDATVEQLDDTELFTRPATDFNSVAVILRHLGGNLRSRWTDFLTTDGEKPDRDRDSDFRIGMVTETLCLNTLVLGGQHLSTLCVR